MIKAIVGLMDFGAGNFASVRHTITRLGYRSRIIKNEKDLQDIAILLLPGVGAFASAMKHLDGIGMIEPIREFAHKGRPLVGICLGMQLLADSSSEHGYMAGLGLIPGEVDSLKDPVWHIGWNNLEILNSKQLAKENEGACVYYNHSYEFKAPQEYVIAIARAERPIISMVRKDNICGFQFHPEKSQHAGLKLMKYILDDLAHA